MARDTQKPHVDASMSRNDRIKYEVDNAKRFGLSAPSWISRAPDFRVQRSSQPATSARMIDATRCSAADRDALGCVESRRSAPTPAAVGDSIRAQAECMRAEVEQEARRLFEQPHDELVGRLNQQLAVLRRAGVDEAWIDDLVRQIDRIAYRGVDFAPIKPKLAGGGARRRDD